MVCLHTSTTSALYTGSPNFWTVVIHITSTTWIAIVLATGVAPRFIADSNRLKTGMTFWSSRLLSLTRIIPSPRRREGKWSRGEGEG